MGPRARSSLNQAIVLNSTSNGISPAFYLDQGFPSDRVVQPPFINPAFGNGNNVRGVTPNGLTLPRFQNWSLTYERQLTRSTMFDVSYWGHNILNHDNGDGSFTDVSVKAGVAGSGTGDVILGRDLRTAICGGIVRTLTKVLEHPKFSVLTCVALLVVAGNALNSQTPVPTDWVDADTGHRVVRLTGEAGGSTLYFHDNTFSPQGDKLMFSTPDGIAVFDVSRIGAADARPEILTGARGGYFARRTREIYYSVSGGGMITAIDVDTKRSRQLANARGLINADETLSVVRNANAADPDGKYPRPPLRAVVPQLQRMFPGKRMEELTPDQQYAVRKEDTLAGRALNPTLQSFIFTNLKTGESRETGFQYGDLNHMQFNPVDPDLLLYCHEGTWHEVDRTWTIRSDGSQMRLMHRRTMDMEINGHEWWSWDGKTVWFDLQTPRSQDFWVAGVNMESGREVRYHLERAWWGIHFNSSRDDTLFASDGGDPSQVAYATDGMWINLLRVQADGTMSGERLVNMSRHNYVTGRGGVEPNVHIAPDKKWVVFTGQFSPGQRHVYAVEIANRKN